MPTTISRFGPLIALALCTACAQTPLAPAAAHTGPTLAAPVDPIALLDRVTWGANTSEAARLTALGPERYLAAQLHPGNGALPPAVQAQIDAMTITQRPVDALVRDLDAQRRAVDANTTMSDADKQAARQAEQQTLNALARESATRFLLRALYSPDQLREQMTWFWMNHFNVHQYKNNLRATIGDYEEHAIRAHALGRFRDLLGATVYHPAMLSYLDNHQNAAGHLNENYARELMELHTLGVNGGYNQNDVQELARVLTGVGVNFTADTPKVKPALEKQYVRRGLFEFNPNRHDYGDKLILGQTVKGRGLAEVDEVLDRLARHPATAHFVSRKLALYFVSDAPSAALVDQMAKTWAQTDGNIAAVLQTMFASPEFAHSLGHKFKDPVHYVVSSVRLAYGDKPILNAGPMLNWLNRMGEPLYGHQTPDGYGLTESAWASAGQLNTRFEIARAIGSGSAGLFKTEGDKPVERPAFPQLANALYYNALQKRLAPATLSALDQAVSPQEWNALLLAAPEFMYH